MTSRRLHAVAARAVAALALAVGFTLGGAPAASAAHGESTPGLVVTAQNSGGERATDLRITMTAHSELAGVPDPSCRPTAATIECWGSLVLRLPELGGLSLRGLDVHRVTLAEGDGHDGGGCGDGGDECGGEGAMAVTGSAPALPAHLIVNGTSTVSAPGTSGLAAGTVVQVKMTLVDYGRAQDTDTIAITINRSAGEDTWKLVYATGVRTIQQVQVHRVDG